MHKNLVGKIGVVALCLLFVTGSALAQSSGNFSTSYSPIACTIDSSNGSFGTTGTSATGGVCNVTGGTGPVTCGLLNAGIKTSSGNGDLVGRQCQYIIFKRYHWRVPGTRQRHGHAVQGLPKQRLDLIVLTDTKG